VSWAGLLGPALGARAIPLAWLLPHPQPVRLAVALGASARRIWDVHAAGLRDGLFRCQLTIHRSSTPSLVADQPAHDRLGPAFRFPRRRLVQSLRRMSEGGRDHAGELEPDDLAGNPENRQHRSILAIGF